MTNKRTDKIIKEIYMILAQEDNKPTKACIERILKQIRHNGFTPIEKADKNHGYIIFKNGLTVYQLAYIKGYSFYNHGFVSYEAA